MKRFINHRARLAAIAGACLLAACGSGSGDSNNGSGIAGGGNVSGNGLDVPVSATTSSAGAFGFVKSLVDAGGSETAEPLGLGGDDVSLGNSEADDADPSV